VSLNFFTTLRALILVKPKKVFCKTQINLNRKIYKITLINTKIPLLSTERLCRRSIICLMVTQNFHLLSIKNKAFMNKKRPLSTRMLIIVLLFIRRAIIKPLKTQDRIRLFLRKPTTILFKMGAIK
jgi:hypothetical protein